MAGASRGVSELLGLLAASMAMLLIASAIIVYSSQFARELREAGFEASRRLAEASSPPLVELRGRGGALYLVVTTARPLYVESVVLSYSNGSSRVIGVGGLVEGVWELLVDPGYDCTPVRAAVLTGLGNVFYDRDSASRGYYGCAAGPMAAGPPYPGAVEARTADPLVLMEPPGLAPAGRVALGESLSITVTGYISARGHCGLRVSSGGSSGYISGSGEVLAASIGPPGLRASVWLGADCGGPSIVYLRLESGAYAVFEGELRVRAEGWGEYYRAPRGGPEDTVMVFTYSPSGPFSSNSTLGTYFKPSGRIAVVFEGGGEASYETTGPLGILYFSIDEPEYRPVYLRVDVELVVEAARVYEASPSTISLPPGEAFSYRARRLQVAPLDPLTEAVYRMPWRGGEAYITASFQGSEYSRPLGPEWGFFRAPGEASIRVTVWPPRDMPLANRVSLESGRWESGGWKYTYVSAVSTRAPAPSPWASAAMIDVALPGGERYVVVAPAHEGSIALEQWGERWRGYALVLGLSPLTVRAPGEGLVYYVKASQSPGEAPLVEASIAVPPGPGHRAPGEAPIPHAQALILVMYLPQDPRLADQMIAWAS